MIRNKRLAAIALLATIGFIAIPPACAGDAGRVLNNLVVELLSIRAPQTQKHQTYTFTNPRDGWIFFSSVASTHGESCAYLIVDSEEKEDAIILHQGDANPSLEAMRKLPAGEHTLNVYCETGASVQGVVVRAIPEILYASVGYWSRRGIGMHTPYTWEFLKSTGLLDNINVALERHPDPGMNVQQWRNQGKKVLTRATTHEVVALGKPITADNVYKVWSEADGFRRPDRDGIMFDELDGYSSPEKTAMYSAYSEGVRRLFEQPEFKSKVLYPYCNVMYRSEASIAFVRELIHAGSKYTEDRYIPEQPTEAAAKKYIEGDLRYVMTKHREAIPDCPQHMILNLGYMSAPPESLNIHPGANYKVFLDMQFNLVANDPVFKDLYGIMCYHSAYADDEILRWSAKLFRHYCIEGKRTMLSTDPYELPHIRNADFAEGATGWTLSPVEEGSMAARSMAGYGRSQGRYGGDKEGDTFLWAKRSAAGPNCFAQQIEKLETGRLYSLKLFTANYQHLLQEESVNERHQVGIRIDNAELLPYKSFQKTFQSFRPFPNSEGKSKPWINYHVLVFRAHSENAKLTISDWVSDGRTPWPQEWGLQLDLSESESSRKPGGPIGQELMFNFIEVQPYLEN